MFLSWNLVTIKYKDIVFHFATTNILKFESYF